MNTIVTSREAILREGRRLAQENGWQEINIRSVAAACGVAVGSIYRYFPSKAELVAALVEEVWKEIFQMPGMPCGEFRGCVRWLFERLREGRESRPEFFTLHSLGFSPEERSQGKAAMERSMLHIRRNLSEALKGDSGVRPGALAGELDPDAFADLVFSMVLSSFLRGDEDCGQVLEVVERCVYR